MRHSGAKTIRPEAEGNAMNMSFDWDHLRIFLTTMRSGSFRGAAELLGVNHGTVQRAISSLESDLGTRVFDRTTGGLRLTQPGEALIEHAEEMERQADTVSRKLTGLDQVPSGVVRLSLPPALSHGLLTDLLDGFSELYPDIMIHVISTNRKSDLTKLEADVSLRVALQVDEDVVGRKLTRFVSAVFATPEYLRTHPDLHETGGAGAHWVGWNSDFGWVRSSAFPNAKPRHVLPEVSMQIEAAVKGLGMIYIPAFVGDADKRLVRIPGLEPDPAYFIWLLFHRDLRRVARVRAFADHVVSYISRNRTMFTQ
jgi:DNA-binding transcriptional LysR family regulator